MRADLIHIKGLRASCVLGLEDAERRCRQEVILDLTLEVDLSAAARQDRLEQGSLNYRDLKKSVLALVERSSFHLLEALAEAVAGACLEFPAVRGARIRIDKPGALRFARTVAVDIVRRQPRRVRMLIGVGSNLEPSVHVRHALQLLAEQVRIIDISTVYRTPPLDRPEQPEYYNCLVDIETSMNPPALKRRILTPIEQRLGRRREADKSAARTIDLDILWTLDGTRPATAPDPELRERPFWRAGLRDLAPVWTSGAPAFSEDHEGLVALDDYTRELRAELRFKPDPAQITAC